MSTMGIERERGVRAVHAAIVAPEYLAALLSGRKTIEARLSRSRRVPYGRVAAGDEVYFRAPAARGFAACGRVARVEEFAGLTPGGVAELRRSFNGGIVGTASFWAGKRRARYATLVWLREVRVVEGAPALPEPGRSAWAVRVVQGVT